MDTGVAIKMNKTLADITQDFNRLDIVPSKIDDILQKACPCAENGNESISSMYNFMHQVFNARLAQDLKKIFAKLNVQHEVVEGNSRLDIRLLNDYQNRVTVGGKNLVVIDMKTGNVKLYQLCLYSVRNQCPTIIVELLSGDVHLLTPEIACKILTNLPSEIEKITEMKSLKATLPGQDCRFCAKECKDRIAKYTPYKVSSTSFAERALKLETNYNKVKERIQEIIRPMVDESTAKAANEMKEAKNVRVSVSPMAAGIQIAPAIKI
ncbi:Uncharacterised protein [uncultured archaeon]|nr:Uncharacterised protein [uncultured archaeon]